ncbi:hypothetical protein [Salmonirosea aquatica]|uniref:Uncharacterized protein n=1 Tax=Salmonirosea aquatica TaxID=2654236 RepID=A0A7C9BFS2_9BACT|nr:hypothetical protein [Cytophagaceae bacterium SJW1-29]
MKIENYRFPFEIFVGNDEGDFKPKYENIDNLKEGDIISVYFYEIENTKKEGLNRFVQFIDKDNISFFERSNSTRTVAYIIISLSIILLFFGLLMWKLGKIGW